MSYEIQIVEAAPTVLASVQKRVAWRQLPVEIPRLLDQVWAFLRADGAPVRPAGHNVCVYRRADAEGCELEAGVQVSGPFADAGAVRCSSTPSGRAVSTVHMGDYAKLGAATDALLAHCRAHGLVATGPGWEVYGDWSEDPAEQRTDVFFAIAR